MLAHADFAKLRLKDLLPGVPVARRKASDTGASARFRGDAIIEVDRWEFDGHECVGELFGFTEVLRLASAPDRTRTVRAQSHRRAVRPSTSGSVLRTEPSARGERRRGAGFAFI